MKEEIHNNTIIKGKFNTIFSTINRSSRQKIKKKMLDLNYTLKQMDLADICKAFHPKAAEYTFFLSRHRTFSRIDHMIGHKISLSKF